ncbi:undecaprenyl-diphosphate phosphatase [Enterobacteriaceae endosymbiont of Donacia semicuprea]|uniref:undecaprenyl-diphosphate phosphatase n=1 Tax=Enterobacteriaceae endosymbiont of Donacia semicuprea TaxID=2675783 RepID=UPI00144938B6|nr:undecaprenyl-diphosphate phosphatase [Enterobacteriaceae endosymbiont of Donacia semicuprea]QJC32902.1 undecaprenyl-diphosphatase [Enterobacteriaceae endosymbiont of Donacia semicuprea]
MLINYTSIIILSIVQGLTEFLPISSSAHIFIFSKILNIIDNNNIQLFKIIIQLGSTLAISLFFWKKIIKIILNTIKFNIFYEKKINLLHIIITTLPVVIIGIIFYYKIKTIINIQNIIYGLFFGGILLYYAEKLKPKKNIIKNINNIKYSTTFFIGCFQSLALFPGISRFGITFSISLLLGLKRIIATEFCFIISIPVIFGANLLELYKNYSIINTNNIKIFILGFIISFITSLVIMKIFLYIINHFSLKLFTLYRLFLILILIYLF